MHATLHILNCPALLPRCLVCLQACQLAYLLVIWPYQEWPLQWMEIAATSLETGIIVVAVYLLTHASTAAVWVMIGLLVATTAVLLLFELYRLVSTLRALWHAWKEYRAEQEAAADKGVEEQHEQGPGSAVGQLSPERAPLQH